MSYSVSRKTKNTKMAEVMTEEDGGGLSSFLTRLVKREWKRRLALGEVTESDLGEWGNV